MKNRLVIFFVIIAIHHTGSFVHARQLSVSESSWKNLPVVLEPKFKTDTIDIRAYGATPDGITLNTSSINAAISACSQQGGGVVLFSDGYWLTGPIELKSNVNLHLKKNALLQFTSDFGAYQIVEGIYEGKPSARNQSPISGRNLHNVAITGKGIIDGNGDSWRMVGKGKLTDSEWQNKISSGGLVSEDGKTWFPSAKVKLAHEENRSVLLTTEKSLHDFEDIKDYLRPNLVVLTNCNTVLLEGVTFQNSPAWNLHPLMCKNLTLRGLLVKNPDYAQNGDGIDIESCSSVVIEDCVLDVGDDAICVKSGKDEDGRKRNMPTENVIIRRNTVYLGHGGFVVGSEMSGGIRNIFVEDCTFIGTDKGLRFKTARGRGGVVENIFVRNINMSNIVNEAIYFDMYYWTKPPAANEVKPIPQVNIETPQFKNIYIENVICKGAGIGVFARGLPEMPVHNVRMKNLVISANTGVQLKDVKGMEIKNLNLNVTKDVPAVYIENGNNIKFDALAVKKKLPVLFELNGPATDGIFILNTDVSKNQIEVRHGANLKAFEIY